MSDTLVINEIYLSLQGESTFAGLPCIFIRLTACDLRCSYCDTAYAFTEGKKKTLAEILAEVKKLAEPFSNSKFKIQHSKLPLIELTGGEPLLQKNSLPLMKSLCDDGFTVLIETSGAHDISKIDPRVHRIMDLKCPSSGEVERNLVFQHRAFEIHRRNQIRHRHGGRLRMGETANRRTQIGFHLPAAVFVGSSARAGTAEQIAEKSSGRTQRRFHGKIWRKKSSPMRCPCVFKSSSTKSSGRRNSAEFDCNENETSSRTAAHLRIAQRPVHGAGRLVADCLGTRQRRSRLGCRRKKVSGFDRRVRRRRRRSRKSKVVKAGQKQMARLLHAMGDVHPPARKAELARELSRVTFERWGKKSGKAIFSNSGFEAVESALKTAMLATGKRGVIAFSGAYHGLGYGALNVTHRDFFRSPFQLQLREFGHFVLFPTKTSDLATVEFQIRNFFRRERVGAILVEPVQARGGINVPPPEFLPLLRKLCDEHGALLILDEIYTGFGRTGKWFACEHSGVIPDLICLGKALTGGFPLSACVGRADLMDAAWPPSRGEAIHTSTFLGHPVGCAMALAQIAEIGKLKLPERSAELGKFLLEELAIKNFRFKISNQHSRSWLDGRSGITIARWQTRDRCGDAGDQSHVATRLHHAARRRIWKCHQLHAAADHHQGATRKSCCRTPKSFSHRLTQMHTDKIQQHERNFSSSVFICAHLWLNFSR